jgi:hypothetical protein
MLFEDFFPVIKEILVENGVLAMRGFQHCSIESSDLFRRRREVDRFALKKILREISNGAWKLNTIVLHFDFGWQRFVRRWENDAIVLECLPFHSIVAI